MTLTTPKAILFDWDNTLVHTWPVIHQALHHTFTALNRTPWTIEEVQARVRKSMRDAFPEVFGPDWQEAGKLYQSHYQAIHLRDLTPFPEAENTLRLLRRLPVFVGVVSNKKGPNLRKEIAHLGWDGYFDAIVGADDAARDKPHPDPVHMALERAPVQAGREVWFVGDSEIDLECAVNLGCRAILYGDVQTDAHTSGARHYGGFPLCEHVKDQVELQRLIRAHLDEAPAA